MSGSTFEYDDKKNIVENFRDYMSINPGTNFHDWIKALQATIQAYLNAQGQITEPSQRAGDLEKTRDFLIQLNGLISHESFQGLLTAEAAEKAKLEAIKAVSGVPPKGLNPTEVLVAFNLAVAGLREAGYEIPNMTALSGEPSTLVLKLSYANLSASENENASADFRALSDDLKRLIKQAMADDFSHRAVNYFKLLHSLYGDKGAIPDTLPPDAVKLKEFLGNYSPRGRLINLASFNAAKAQIKPAIAIFKQAPIAGDPDVLVLDCQCSVARNNSKGLVLLRKFFAGILKQSQDDFRLASETQEAGLKAKIKACEELAQQLEALSDETPEEKAERNEKLKKLTKEADGLSLRVKTQAAALSEEFKSLVTGVETQLADKTSSDALAADSDWRGVMTELVERAHGLTHSKGSDGEPLPARAKFEFVEQKYWWKKDDVIPRQQGDKVLSDIPDATLGLRAKMKAAGTALFSNSIPQGGVPNLSLAIPSGASAVAAAPVSNFDQAKAKVREIFRSKIPTYIQGALVTKVTRQVKDADWLAWRLTSRKEFENYAQTDLDLRIQLDVIINNFLNKPEHSNLRKFKQAYAQANGLRAQIMAWKESLSDLSVWHEYIDEFLKALDAEVRNLKVARGASIRFQVAAEVDPQGYVLPGAGEEATLDKAVAPTAVFMTDGKDEVKARYDEVSSSPWNASASRKLTRLARLDGVYPANFPAVKPGITPKLHVKEGQGAEDTDFDRLSPVDFYRQKIEQYCTETEFRNEDLLTPRKKLTALALSLNRLMKYAPTAQETTIAQELKLEAGNLLGSSRPITDNDFDNFSHKFTARINQFSQQRGALRELYMEFIVEPAFESPVNIFKIREANRQNQNQERRAAPAVTPALQNQKILASFKAGLDRYLTGRRFEVDADGKLVNKQYIGWGASGDFGTKFFSDKTTQSNVQAAKELQLLINQISAAPDGLVTQENSEALKALFKKVAKTGALRKLVNDFEKNALSANGSSALVMAPVVQAPAQTPAQTPALSTV